MQSRTLRSGIWMRDLGSRATAHGLQLRERCAAIDLLGSSESWQRGASFRCRQGRSGGNGRRASVSLVFPASLAVMMGPEKA